MMKMIIDRIGTRALARLGAAACIAALCYACASAPTPQQVTASTDAAVQKAAPTVAMACWAVSAADAAFKAFYVGGKAPDPAVVADEAKAVTAADAICANPPTDTASAIAAVMAAYKSVVGETPAAAPAAPAAS